MNIAIISHDAKKELMSQFCTAYCGILSKHVLFATGTTGHIVSEATGLKIQCLYSGHGGLEQVESMISCDELDLIIMFRDPSNPKGQPEEGNLMRLCDVHNVPFATNIATAEALVHALERGDLDWREILKQNRHSVY